MAFVVIIFKIEVRKKCEGFLKEVKQSKYYWLTSRETLMESKVLEAQWKGGSIQTSNANPTEDIILWKKPRRRYSREKTVPSTWAMPTVLWEGRRCSTVTRINQTGIQTLALSLLSLEPSDQVPSLSGPRLPQISVKIRLPLKISKIFFLYRITVGINSIIRSSSNDLLSIHMCQALDLSLK